MVEIVGLASGPLIVALNLLQLVFMLGIVVISLLMARRGKTWVGYILALGIVSLATHNVVELLTEVENLPVVVFKTIATVLIFLAMWLFSARESERLKLAGYSEKLEKEVESRAKGLRESEERYRGLVVTSTDAIISADEKGEITLWNNAAEKVFGYTEEEARGLKLVSIMPDEYRERHMLSFKRYLETGEARVIGRTVELQGLRRDGTVFPLELSLSHQRTGEKHIFTAVIRDITEKKRIEDLRVLFMDIMRHDLLNPASIIRGAADLMLTESPGKEELLMIRGAAEKLIDMIETASKLSRLESVDELVKENLDLKEVIDGVVEANRPLLESSGVAIDNRVTSAMPVKANPVIEEVFLNLLSNAAKYAADGKMVVIEALDGDKNYTILVKDYGPGVPDEDKERIFKRFTRGKKAGVKGTGLGLAIAKRIVELHNGRIWMEDNTRRGSIFCVKLPKKV